MGVTNSIGFLKASGSDLARAIDEPFQAEIKTLLAISDGDVDSPNRTANLCPYSQGWGGSADQTF
jgi:hypothetical protein